MTAPAPLLRHPPLGARLGLVHGFSSRRGGVSEGPLASLNLALRAGERPERLLENWDRAALGLDPALSGEDVALLDQVHGATVVEVSLPGGPLEPVGEGDAMVTTTPGVILAIRVADCVPVLLAGPGGVAAVHAGWRGVVAGVVPAAVAALTARCGCGPEALVAGVGPCIGGECYEVGPEVVDALRGTGLTDEAFLAPAAGPRPHVDLGAAVLAQLAAAGVTQAGRLPVCTACERSCYSHRRDGPETGRQAALIALLR